MEVCEEKQEQACMNWELSSKRKKLGMESHRGGLEPLHGAAQPCNLQTHYLSVIICERRISNSHIPRQIHIVSETMCPWHRVAQFMSLQSDHSSGQQPGLA